MKKQFVVVLAFAAAVAGGVIGCSGAATQAWFSDFQKNPVAKAQAFEQTVQTALNIADTVWNSVKMFLPSDIVMKAQPKYTKAVLVVNKSLVALTDAVQTAADAKTPNPDMSKLMQDASDALASVTAVIDEFKDTPAPLKAGPDAMPKPEVPEGYEDLQTATLTVKRVGGTK
jgi:hypothetical protein